MAPDAALLQVAKPALDERLRFGVAVAAAAVADAERADCEPRGAGGEGEAIVGADRERSRRDPLLVDGLLDQGGCLGGAAAQLEAPADDLAGAAVDDRVQVAPAVLGDPDRGHVQVPELSRPFDLEDARTAPTRLEGAELDQLLLTHHPQDPLAVDRDPRVSVGRSSRSSGSR